MKTALCWGLVFLGAYKLGVLIYEKSGILELEIFANAVQEDEA